MELKKFLYEIYLWNDDFNYNIIWIYNLIVRGKNVKYKIIDYVIDVIIYCNF